MDGWMGGWISMDVGWNHSDRSKPK